MAETLTNQYRRIDSLHHLHPFTNHMRLADAGTRIITEAQGVYIWDSDGNRILDGMAGLWCVNVGYGRKELAEAAAAQMRRLPYYNSFFQSASEPTVLLSERLASLADGFSHVFFTNSGSEANDTVVRMVRHYWSLLGQPGRSVIVSRRNAYHGSTVAAASLGGMAFMHAQGGLPIPGIEHIAQPYAFGEGRGKDPGEFGLEAARDLQRKIDEVGADRVAAFIAEPVQGAGGVVIPPDSYWPEIARICEANGILLVADEVICGFGRLGRWFGSQHFGIKADLMPIAKGLTSGYLPMGGVMVGSKVAEVFANRDFEFAHGYTYSGHPACAAVALENLRILEDEDILARVRDQTAPSFQKALATLADHPLVGEVRGVGMLGAIELVRDRDGAVRFDESAEAGKVCRDAALDAGLVMRAARDTMLLSPPLTITMAEIDELAGRARKALDRSLEVLQPGA